ncbi:MAG: hypothetical protein ACR2OC_10260 [Solirubrobacterales bacterium]
MRNSSYQGPGEGLKLAYEAVDNEFADESGHTRRKLIGATAATLGGMAVMTLPEFAKAEDLSPNNTVENILAVAATAEVLATIVNTVGSKVKGLDKVTKTNVQAAAQQELEHYNVLKSLGAQELTKKIWIPNDLFKKPENLLNGLQFGDQVFINAYMIGTTAFGDAGDGEKARYTAEFMGVEAVHRALARQSLGLLGNDRVFMRFSQKEQAKGAPDRGTAGFTDILDAPKALQGAGFGFGAEGAKPGKFYDFDKVSKETPKVKGVNTFEVN